MNVNVYLLQVYSITMDMSMPLEFCYNNVMSDRTHFEYPELDEPVDLVIHTRSPKKWLLIDRETGQVYEGGNGKWDKLISKDILRGPLQTSYSQQQ